MNEPLYSLWQTVLHIQAFIHIIWQSSASLWNKMSSTFESGEPLQLSCVRFCSVNIANDNNTEKYQILVSGFAVRLYTVVSVCGVCLLIVIIGSCTIGWAYWATVCAATLLVVSSWLACFAAKRKGAYQRRPATSSAARVWLWRATVRSVFLLVATKHTTADQNDLSCVKQFSEAFTVYSM